MTLPTSRVKPDARAVGGDVELLVDVGAVEEHRVVAGLALDGVAAVAGVPDEGVVAGAHQGHVVAGAADDEVVPLAADEDVLAGSAVEGQGDRVRLESTRVDGVVAREGVDRELVARPIASRDVHRGGQARDRDAGRRARNLDLVGVVGAVDDHGVGLAVAGPRACSTGQVEVELGDAGAGQVVDGDGVGAAQGVEVDHLDAVEVHHDVADVAGEPDARAVGGDVELLAGVGAVEAQGVVAALALDCVAAIAGVPDGRCRRRRPSRPRRCRGRRR